ncbi:MAG TPA: RNA methyltransferase [Nitrospirae bacterium]|nr:RNA methyltransferase [Nitrospirota bacterium]
MKQMGGLNARLAVGLVHYPVVNKFNEVVTSSVTTIDVHDIARLCRTFGVPEFYVITPLSAQRRLVQRIMKHWIEGFGGEYNPDRREALSIVKVVDTIDDMMENLRFEKDDAALIVSSAHDSDSAVSYEAARASLKKTGRAALLFGTAHGLDGSVLLKADIRLKPVKGAGEYNHLPVRCAASIILSGLLKQDTEK